METKDFLPALPREEVLPVKQEHRDLIAKSITNDYSVPEFKLKHFIAGSQIHPFHQIRQLLIELNTRQESVERFVDDIDRLEAEIELEEQYKETAEFPAQIKIHDIEIRAKRRSLAVAREKIRSLLHEREKFLKAIEEFNSSPAGRDPETNELYIDIMNDPIRSEQIEAKYWEYRLAKQAAMDMIAYGRIGVGNMDAIMQLNPDAQNKCLAMAYEVLISNEHRMNMLADGVQKRLELGKPVSDITGLIGIQKTETLQQLTNEQGQHKDVPLIQKR